MPVLVLPEDRKMQTLTSSRYAAALGVAALLAGCSAATGSQVPATIGGAPAMHVFSKGTLVIAPGVRPNLERQIVAAPLIRPNCCAREKVLFVTDSAGGSSFTGAVYAFDFKTGKELGQLPAPPPTGWSLVQGACVDTAGNVYFANTNDSDLVEYSHSGTYLATLNDAERYPVGCAYDRTTGNLAVSNITDASGGNGSISIFKNGVVQKTYYPIAMTSVYFVGYQDGTSILWIDGKNSSGIFQYDKFANGAFTPVKITGGSIGFPGGVQWSAKTHIMNVGDQTASATPTVYQVSSTGRVVGSTVLTCPEPSLCEFVQFAIKGARIVAPDALNLNVQLYSYPAGGQPIGQYNAVEGYVLPIGAAVSPNVP